MNKFLKLILNNFYQLKYSTAPTYHIYTDGSQKGIWGAWAFVIVQKGRILFKNAGRVRKSSSNEMEFQAVIQALQVLTKTANVIIYSDSRIVVDSMTLDTPSFYTQNVNTIKKLEAIHRVKWQWIKAHSGIVHNEICDKLCAQMQATHTPASQKLNPSSSL